MSGEEAPVDIHVDRIVLDGVRLPPHRADAFRLLLEGEIGRLLQDGPRPAAANLRRVRAAPLRPAEAIGERALARGVAQRVVATLRGGSRHG